MPSNSLSKIRESGLTRSGKIPRQIFDADRLPDSALLPLPVVEGLLGICANTVWRWSRAGILSPIRIGHTTRWSLGEIRAKIQEGRKKEKRQHQVNAVVDNNKTRDVAQASTRDRSLGGA